MRSDTQPQKLKGFCIGIVAEQLLNNLSDVPGKAEPSENSWLFDLNPEYEVELSGGDGWNKISRSRRRKERGRGCPTRYLWAILS